MLLVFCSKMGTVRESYMTEIDSDLSKSFKETRHSTP